MFKVKVGGCKLLSVLVLLPGIYHVTVTLQEINK